MTVPLVLDFSEKRKFRGIRGLGVTTRTSFFRVNEQLPYAEWLFGLTQLELTCFLMEGSYASLTAI